MVKGDGFIAAIGNFDGVHRGHQHLLAETIAFAHGHGKRAAAITFDPHPRRYFRPDDPAFLLTGPAMRNDLLREYGAEEVFVLNFDKQLASQTPETFMAKTLKQDLGLSGVVAGADFRFGKGRAGGIEVLQTIGEEAGLLVRIAEVISEKPFAEKYSSSDARTAITDGDMAKAAHILGRPWAVRGSVVEGQKLGRTLGFPTANLTLGDVLSPRIGVYATRAIVDGKPRDGVSNYGRRPTIGPGDPLLETYLFDFDSDLYGREIDIEFVAFIRDEQKFDGLDALKAAISSDCERARAILADNPRR